MPKKGCMPKKEGHHTPLRIFTIIPETYVDGPGVRYAIYISGCEHYCEGCHNPETWNFEAGENLNTNLLEKIKKDIESNPLLDGVTISGGEPLHPLNLEGTLQILKETRPLVGSIWLYTGYLYEEVKSSDKAICLDYLDIMVDSPFILHKKENKTFKGSSNQRFIKL